MAKYSIIFLCYLFSCFVAVVPHVLEENVKSKFGTSFNVSSHKSRDLITFSDQHGVNAVLSSDRRTVTKTSRDGGLALVYTNRPLERNEFFEVKITEMEPDCNTPNPFPFGATLTEPSSLLLSYDIFISDAPSWMIYWRSFLYNPGTGFGNTYTYYLPELPKLGDRLGVLHKSDGGLIFYYNGNQLDSAAGTPGNTYVFLELHGCYKSVQIY